MLYLAEVLRKARVIGGSRAELKLLACQRTELNWSAVPGEEVIPAPDDMSYGSGALVMIELSAAKQVQRYAEAGRQIVSILQNFSRLQEKSKTQEEEIEQWKQSLTYQSQELNRREMEIEAAQDQMQQLEEDFARLDKQQQEIETAQAEVDRLKQEFERKAQELEGAWAHLRGEESRIQEQQSNLQQMTVLDAGQAHYFQELLNRLAETETPAESIQAQIEAATEIMGHQQETLNGYWQDLEQQRASTQQLQTEVDQQTQGLQERWQAWQQAQSNLEQVRRGLETQQAQLQLKQNYAQSLSHQLQAQSTLYQEVEQLADGSVKLNMQHLEQLPIDELQTVVRDLEADLEKLSRFVSSQEEELTLQQQEIDAIQSQIQQVSEYDRLRLETELADERDRYQMLHETLIGQRRNLQERQATLVHHQAVLAKRQGFAPPAGQERSVDVERILVQIDQVRQQLISQQQNLAQEIASLQAEIEPLQASVAQQTTAQEVAWTELQQLDQQTRAQIAAVANLWGKTQAYEEFLRPVQDHLDRLRQKAGETQAILAQLQATSGSQQQVIHEMREAVQRLTAGAPTAELAAS